jgi:class 3 adenylate cyclase
MTRLVEPRRHRAAVLFADIQASGVLSRRLSSAAYFKLVRAATTAIDEVVVDHLGIVGKHAGDGVTAFFLADDLGSASGAARAAIDAGQSMPGAAYRAAVDLGEEVGPMDLRDSALNVGVHWGGALFMGQVVTGGRLEVTALGDEVNEAARIQQSARDGAVLASKSIVERLEDGDARDLGIDPDRVTYRTIAELSGVTEKAMRDAGTIPVTTLNARREGDEARAPGRHRA